MKLEKELPPKMPELKWEGQNIPFKIMEFIIQAGIQAPSADNTQPWQFSIYDNRITLRINPKSDTSFFNIQQRTALLSCGAVIENIKIAASAFGLSCIIQLNTKEIEPSYEVAQIYLINNKVKCDNLFHSIWERCTNRNQYSRKKLDPHVFEELKKISQEFIGVNLHSIEDKIKLKMLKSAHVKIGIVRTENPLIHQFLNNHIRNSFKIAQKFKTGFALNNLRVGYLGNIVIKLTKNWTLMSFLNKFGFAKIVSSKVEQGIDNCGACILITVPDNSAISYIKGGQVLERIWLKLSALGVAAQPMTTITFFQLHQQLNGMKNFDPKHHQLLREGFAEYEKLFPEENFTNRGQIMLIRLGYSKGIKTWTVRQPAKSLIQQTTNTIETGLHQSVS